RKQIKGGAGSRRAPLPHAIGYAYLLKQGCFCFLFSFRPAGKTPRNKSARTLASARVGRRIVCLHLVGAGRKWLPGLIIRSLNARKEDKDGNEETAYGSGCE